MNAPINTEIVNPEKISLKPKMMSHIRSFVRREGRMTDAQEEAMLRLWEKYGLSIETKSDPFPGSKSPLVIEIGFGMGQSLFQIAKANPEKNYIGIEVHRPGVGALMAMLEEHQIKNVRIYSTDAILVLKECIQANSVSEVLIYFPDPWPKKRHHKRRLIQPYFLSLILNILKPLGIIHCATDWEDYAHHMMEVLTASSDLENTAGAGKFSERPLYRPETKFEQRGQRLGHAIFDLIFKRRNEC